MVYIGFPDIILPQMEALSQSKGLKFEKCNEKHCCISGFEQDNGFEQWFKSIPIATIAIRGTKSYDEMVKKIKEYPVFYKTPLETVQFVAELQTNLSM